MVDQFTSVEVFENEIGQILSALEELNVKESAVEDRYTKLENECKQDFDRQKRETDKKRWSEVSAAKGQRTEQEQKAHAQFDSDLKELTVARRNQVAVTGKERERRRLALETSHNLRLNEARQHTSEETDKLQEFTDEAQAEAKIKIEDFAGIFEKEYYQQLLNEVKDYLIQIKSLMGKVLTDGHRLENKREQIIKQTSDLLAWDSKNEEEIMRLAGEIEAYVQAIPRSFGEHEALYTPTHLNNSHKALPVPFNSTTEALSQMQACHAAVAAIYSRLLTLDAEVAVNRRKATVIGVSIFTGIVLIIVLFILILIRFLS